MVKKVNKTETASKVEAANKVDVVSKVDAASKTETANQKGTVNKPEKATRTTKVETSTADVKTEKAVQECETCKITPPEDKKYSVTVYSKPDCMQCEFTKDYLNKLGVPFNNIDVTENEEALEAIREHGYLGVPVVAINTLADSWGGFRPERLEELKGVKE